MSERVQGETKSPWRVKRDDKAARKARTRVGKKNVQAREEGHKFVKKR